jgi:hypothetical protein
LARRQRLHPRFAQVFDPDAAASGCEPAPPPRRQGREAFGYGLDELARRFDRSTSWVSRRLALVELLPEAIQQQVREGKLGAQVAMKYLVPVARVNADDCTRMAAVFVAHRCDTRQAGQIVYGFAQRRFRSP